jgi:hypothetical protein
VARESAEGDRDALDLDDPVLDRLAGAGGPGPVPVGSVARAGRPAAVDLDEPSVA